MNTNSSTTFFAESFITCRRQKTATSFECVLKSDDLVLVCAGEPMQKPGGLDQTYDFLPHPDAYWLTGRRLAMSVIAFSPSEGWKDFVRLPTLTESLWESAEEAPQGTDLNELGVWLAQRNFGRIFILGQPSSQQAALKKGAEQPEILAVQEALNQVRRHKDAPEIALIEATAKMAAAGYQLLSEIIRPGISERQIQIEYEAEVYRAGAERMPYSTIVGAGLNSAILHATPGANLVRPGDLVLIDAGADVQDYGVDITRVFSADQKFDSQQQALYDLVLAAQSAGIALCRPGIQWTRVHEAAARVMAEGLRGFGLLQGSVDDCLNSGAISQFFPHGIGHMVGHRVRDVGGIAGQYPAMVFGVRLRVDIELQDNFIMTVEPGLYFVKSILQQDQVRKRFKDQINWTEVDKWQHIGGVRLEDDILVHGSSPQNLTGFIPK